MFPSQTTYICGFYYTNPKGSIQGCYSEFYRFFGILFAFVHALEEETQKGLGFCLPIFNLAISSLDWQIITHKHIAKKG